MQDAAFEEYIETAFEIYQNGDLPYEETRQLLDEACTAIVAENIVTLCGPCAQALFTDEVGYYGGKYPCPKTAPCANWEG